MNGDARRPERIAVLGGGASSLTAVFHLTNLEDWKDRYEITVYQMGWRLGGKGASGRDAQRHMRNEEHGLHVMFGCYENVFRMLNAVYREVRWEAGEEPWAIEDAFKPHDLIAMFERHQGRWKRWDFEAVRADGFPGEGEPLQLGPGNYVRHLIRWARGQVTGVLGLEAADTGERAEAPEVAGAVPRWEALEAAVTLPRWEAPEAGSGPLEALDAADALIDDLESEAARFVSESASPQSLEGLVGDFAWRRIVSLAESVLRWVRRIPILGDDTRHMTINAEFALIVAIGLLRDGVIFPRENWFAIDDYDLREWLERHGASRAVVESAPTQGLYDAVFSWNAPIGAGTILHALARASHYKGAILYKMQAGMGDTIFAPLYRVLKARGVKFRFFHAVQDLQLSEDGTRLGTIVFDRQARLKGMDYEPLIDVDGRPCWPNRPLYEQLHEEDARELRAHDPEDWWDPWRGEEVRLRAGVDFERVILGISIGAFPYMARDLIEDAGNPGFADMVHSLVTTQTQCSQLWMEPDLAALGWRGSAPITIPYEEPFDTWADMSHLLAEERFPQSVKSCAYLCSSLDDDEPPAPRSDDGYSGRQEKRVVGNVTRWLERSAGTLWPAVATRTDGTGFDWGCLFDASGATGEARLQAQFHIATRNPSDRYVRIVPGSSRKRLTADASGYANVVLAGDWLRTGMSLGCLESAVEGGIQAARAVDARVPRPAFDWVGEPLEQAALMRRGASPYIVRDGEMLVVPPVGLEVDMSAFVLAADLRSLQRICDRELNLGGSRRYWPVGPFVVAYCSDLLNVTPAGSIGELDFGIWIPVFSGDDGVPRRLLTYTPYLWVSNSPAVVGGRAVFGYPKHQARLVLPGPGDPARFEVETWVTRLQGKPAEELPLLQIERLDGPAGTGTHDEWSADAALDAILRMLQTGVRPPLPTLELLGQLLGGGLPNVFLKEIPEIDGTWQAAYRAIAESEIEMTSAARSGPLPGRWEARLLQAWSHQIAARLGVATRREVAPNGLVFGAAPVLVSWWMRFRARVQPGRVVGS